jgi:hypothetical protein
MSVKIYNKRGKPNYKEQKLIKELQPIIDAKIQANPELKDSFSPASNMEQLQAMHRQYTSQEVDFEDIDSTNTKNPSMSKESAPIDEKEPYEDMDGSSDFIDPFNRQEPTTYDYTLDGGLSPGQERTGPTKTSFDEPMSFAEAFELPDDEDSEAQPESAQSGPKKPQQKSEQKSRPERPEPLNSSFDEMSSGKKKRSTKKFAKYIVEAVCMLAEKGFIWWTTKDINEAKLAEYELNGEIDLSLLVTLETGQEVTVRQFFQHKCIEAAKLAKFEPEAKADLAEVLAEFFLEKGIAPTTSQELLLIAGQMVGEKVISGMQSKLQIGALIEQLKEMQAASPTKPRTYNEPSQTQQEAYQEVEQKMGKGAESIVEEMPIEQVMADLENNSLEIEEVLETKE